MAPGPAGTPHAHRVPAALRDGSRPEPGAHPSAVIAGGVGVGLRGASALFACAYGALAAKTGGRPGTAEAFYYRVAGGVSVDGVVKLHSAGEFAVPFGEPVSLDIALRISPQQKALIRKKGFLFIVNYSQSRWSRSKTAHPHCHTLIAIP